MEDRVCPTLSVVQSGSTLLISGVPVNTGATLGLVVTETSQGIFRVMDGTTFKGSFPASNITMNFISRNSTPVTLNLGGFTLPGNLLVNAGLGIVNNPGTHGMGIGNGTIGGNITYLGGSGNEDLYLGLDYQGHNTLGGNLAIGGNVLFSPTKAGNNVPTNLLNVLITTATAVAGTNVTIGGSVTAVNVGLIELGGGSSVGGNVTVSSSSLTTPEFAFFDGVIGKSLTVSGTVNGVQLLIGSNAPTAQVKGSVLVNTGVGASTVDLAAGAVINGSATINSGPEADTYTIDGNINGSLAVSTGAGADSYEESGNVDGSVKLVEGNGSNLATTFSGAIAGNLTIIQGNGNNAAGGGVTVTGSVAGMLSYTGGNGTDALSITPAAAAFYNISVCFGTNTAANAYTLTFNANDTLTGTIKGKGGNNTFNQNGANLLPTLLFINFP